MKRRVLGLAPLVLLVPALALGGGYAHIKVSELPKSISAGKPVTVEFSVRDAAGDPMSNLKPVVVATRGNQRVEVPATRLADEGRYSARLAFPGHGAWTLTVDSRYCHNTCTLRNVQVAAR